MAELKALLKKAWAMLSDLRVHLLVGGASVSGAVFAIADGRPLLAGANFLLGLWLVIPAWRTTGHFYVRFVHSSLNRKAQTERDAQ